ncbi:MAG: putative zinc-binding metallopeptidase [Burkholderiaceae bacterium]
MKLFACERCAAPVYFENEACLGCGAVLAFDSRRKTMVVAPGNGTGGLDESALCSNRRTAAQCNWLALPGDKDNFCHSCSLTSVIPDQNNDENREAWRRAEAAKRHWLFSILQLGLEARPKFEGETRPGLTFEILQPTARLTKVLTGHQNGKITINAAEADPVALLAKRTGLDEPYRTLLGHFRHESGHYYWQLLVQSNPALLASFRERFGDERQDYKESLNAHYSAGPIQGWQANHVSAYAASHPWEDFAETWAHYLHMTDSVDLAASWRAELGGYPQAETQKFVDPVQASAQFKDLLSRWLPLSLFANSLNRSLGHEDAYPFAPSPVALNKLAWIHDNCLPAAST